MDNVLMSKTEVARRLHICERSLATYGSKYPIYKADSAGVYHIEHVRILEKVRAKILTPEEGWSLWQYHRQSIRRDLLGALEPVKAPRRAVVSARMKK